VKPRKWQVSATSCDGLRTPGEGFRVGELCGLHLSDLHLREGSACGECRSPHVHICHRDVNPNRARAKIKHEWVLEDSTVRGGLIRRASPAMIHTYFEYMTTQYPRDAGHGMLLVQLHGPARGEPWSTAGVRRMLRCGGLREDLGKVRPHEFRHYADGWVMRPAVTFALAAAAEPVLPSA
jgi:integrase